MRVLSGIPEIDKLEHEIALPAPELVGSVDQLLPNIEAVQISAKTRGLDKLSDHSALRRVVARGIGDNELEYIGRITWLEQLELAAPTSRDLGALQNLSGLRILSTSNGSRLESFAGIENLRRLQLLSSSNTPKLASIDVIGSLADLRILFLAGGMYKPIRIPSLRPLSSLDRLLKLVLSNVRVDEGSLGPLAGLKSLRRLSLPLYFAAEEFMMLERSLPNALGDWRDLWRGQAEEKQ